MNTVLTVAGLWFVASILTAAAGCYVLRRGATRPDRDQRVQVTPRGWSVLTVLGAPVGLLIGVLALDGLWLAVDWR